jgi:hypothetical protein
MEGDQTGKNAEKNKLLLLLEEEKCKNNFF